MQITTESLKDLIEAIHATPQMVAIEFAGAGTQALAWLHGVGGSSRTVLEATDRYAATSLISSIGFEPEQFTSPRVARAMATTAYIRACHLTTPGAPVAGIGCTAAIATDRVKRGDHRCCLAVCDDRGITSYTLTLTKGRRTRQEEENLLSLLILRAVARVCGVRELPTPPLIGEERLEEDFEPVDLLARLVAGEIDWLTASPDGHLTPGENLSNIALVSGAFNPLHDGHRQLASVAAKILGQKVYFELPLVNADKAPIAPAEAHRRLAQFADFAPVILTRAPLFDQKASLFPHSVFVIGVDTTERLFQPRFYHDDPAEMFASLAKIRSAGCRFLVAGRLSGGRFVTLRDLSLPTGYRELFDEIPESDFRVDISSTAFRERRKVF